MAVAFVAAGALAGTATLAELSLVAPTCSVDDILIAAINAKDNQVWTAPAGWTKFVESDNTTGQRVTLAWKRAESGDSAATFVFTVPVDNNITYHGMISAWSGCVTTGTPIDASTPTVDPAAVAQDSIDYATFDPTETTAYVVAIGFYNDDLTTAGTISGTDPTLTNRWDLSSTTGTDASIMGYSGSSTGAATGARSHSTTSMADAINVGVLFGLVGASSLEQLTFRGRNDDGTETGAFWRAAVNTGWTQAVDANFRVRFEIEEDNAVAIALVGQLQYNLAAAGWNNVTGSSSVVKSVASASIADGVATTNILTGSAKTFTAGSIDEVDGACASVSLNNTHTELEYVLQIVSGDVTDGQTLQLRVTNNGTALQTYTQTPTITVSELEIAVNTDLISFWKLDEASGTRVDNIGTNDLTDNNTVTQATGKIGDAAQFTRANSEYLSRADNESLSTGDIDFSVAAWVFLDSLATQSPIIGKWSGVAGGLEYVLIYQPPAGGSVFDFFVSSNGTAAASRQATSFGTPVVSTWHYVVAWHDSVNNTLNIQVNDGPVNSTAYTLGVFDSAQELQIGRNTGEYAAARIDATGFWKKVLNNNERTYMYNNGAGREIEPLVQPTTEYGKHAIGRGAVASHNIAVRLGGWLEYFSRRLMPA